MKQSRDIAMVELKGIEEKVKKYYEDQSLLNMLKPQLDHWKKSKDELLRILEYKKSQLEKDNIQLETHVSGVNYENLKSNNTGGNVGLSQQEKAIDIAYEISEREIKNLEYRLQVTSKEIISIENRLLNLELENYCMKMVIDSIDDEEISKLLELRYKLKKSHLQISYIVKMSESGICHNLKKALIYLSNQYSGLELGKELALC